MQRSAGANALVGGADAGGVGASPVVAQAASMAAADAATTKASRRVARVIMQILLATKVHTVRRPRRTLAWLYTLRPALSCPSKVMGSIAAARVRPRHLPT
jgi:hypothetical protein